MYPKNRFTIGNFHHITITLYNGFIISPYEQKILDWHHKIWKTEKNAPFHPESIFDSFQSSYHITTSPYHDFTISPFHPSAAHFNPCSI